MPQSPAYRELIDRLAADSLAARGPLDVSIWTALDAADLAIIVTERPAVLTELLDGTQRLIADALTGPARDAALGQSVRRLLAWACADAIEADVEAAVATRRREARAGALSEAA